MKKKSLGARLLRAQNELRQYRYEEAVAAAGDEGPLLNIDANAQVLVSQMFESARMRLTKTIEMDVGMSDARVILGVVDPGRRAPLSSEAIRILSDACWPMTIPEGIQLSGNPFHYEWDALTNWAAKERLAVEITAEVDKYRIKTDFFVVVKPR